MNKVLTHRTSERFLKVLQHRFENNISRHELLDWKSILEKLRSNPKKLWSIYQMDATGGEPDVVGYEQETDTYSFVDCSKESPKGRRNLCYYKEEVVSKTQYKIANTAYDLAEAMGIVILNEQEYIKLHKLGDFDSKSSSWLNTPEEILELGGAIFGDFRYNKVFIYYNSPKSYFISRGFRGVVKL